MAATAEPSIERLLGRAAVERLVEREKGERAAVGRRQRHDQRVVGLRGVRLADHELVVVPGRAMQVDGDGRVAQRLRDGGGGGFEQPAQVVARAHDGGHVEQRAQACEGGAEVGRDGHAAFYIG